MFCNWDPKQMRHDVISRGVLRRLIRGASCASSLRTSCWHSWLSVLTEVGGRKGNLTGPCVN